MKLRLLFLLPILVLGLLLATLALRANKPAPAVENGPRVPFKDSLDLQSNASRTINPPSSVAPNAHQVKLFSVDEVKGMARKLCADFEGLVRAGALRAGTSRFLMESQCRFVNGRLLALAYPESVLEIAAPLALDSTKSDWERIYASYLLACLARGGNKMAESALVQVCLASTGTLSECALDQLAYQDKDGNFQTLYAQKAKEGSIAGLRALSQWPNPGNAEFLRQIIQTNSSGLTNGDVSASERYRAAERALNQFHMLSQPDWQIQLDKVIKTSSHENSVWVLGIASKRGLIGFAESIRTRLDSAYAEVSNFLTKRNEAFPDRKTEAEYEIATKAIPGGLSDLYFDEVLLAAFEAKIPLRNFELSRLRAFGYACDPKERLAELLAEQPK